MKLILTPCLTGMFLFLMNLQPLPANAGGRVDPTAETPARQGLFRKSKSKASRNNNAVKIYPDPVRRAIHVVAKENKGMEIDFFVFDLQGSLIEHLKLESGDHERLTGLTRGKYIYRVFAGDEETATGDFDMR
ncbi:MAG: T9SS type A sorting domain-containing protein [Chitinophagaceae bacterium]